MQGEGRLGIGPVDQFSPERAEPRLHCGVGEGRVDGVREALEAVNNGDEDVLYTPGLQVVHDRQPEFCPLVRRDPQAQDLAFPLRIGPVTVLFLPFESIFCHKGDKPRHHDHPKNLNATQCALH